MKTHVLQSEISPFCLFCFETCSLLDSLTQLCLNHYFSLFCLFKLFSANFAEFNLSLMKKTYCNIHCSSMLQCSALCFTIWEFFIFLWNSKIRSFSLLINSSIFITAFNLYWDAANHCWSFYWERLKCYKWMMTFSIDITINFVNFTIFSAHSLSSMHWNTDLILYINFFILKILNIYKFMSFFQTSSYHN